MSGLILKNTQIAFLPEGLKVDGDLDLRGSDIISLPQKLIVDGNLFLNEKITTIPKENAISQNLYLCNDMEVQLEEGAFVLGQIIGTTKISKEIYKRNTIYKNFVCCDNGQIIPFTKQKTYKRDKILPGQIEKPTLVFFLGLFKNKNAVYCQKLQKIFSCTSFSQGEDIVDIALLHLRDEELKKYYELDFNTKYTVPEIREMFEDICHPCTIGADSFIENFIDSNKLYSLKEFMSVLQQNTPKEDRFLFEEVFAKQLKKEKNNRRLF